MNALGSIPFFGTHSHGSGVRVEIVDGKLRDLAISAASQQRRLHERAKLPIARVDQALCFGNGEVANAGLVDALEWLDLAPRGITLSLPFAECMVQRSA